MTKETVIHKVLNISQTKSMKLSAKEIDTLIAEVKKNAQLELLNWFMKVCSSSLNSANVRRIAHNKFVEISGEGEKA